ncbi:MAG: hypothetical protein ACHQ2E_10090 [Gemmatimonadales bacterium]
MTTIAFRTAAVIAAAFGAAAWLAIGLLTHRTEAWDSDLYFSWFFPSLALVLVGLGYFAPERPGRLAFLPFAGQAVVMFVRNPTGSLLPLGLIMLAVYGALFMLPALAGGALRRWLEARSGRP